MWCGGLLWLVVSAVVYRCDLMCRLIKLYLWLCKQSDLVGWLCVHREVRSTTKFVGVGLGRVDGQVKEWIWTASGLFGDEISMFVEGMYVELFICC